MNIINRDSVVALTLLLLCGLFLNAVGDIRITKYGTITSDLWPRIVLIILSVLCMIYFLQSIRKPIETEKTNFSLHQWFLNYKNAIASYSLFGLFVWTLPLLGMLVGGIIFVFLILSFLGKKNKRSLIIHVAISVISIVLMWSIFTFGLGVMLPEGQILRLPF